MSRERLVCAAVLTLSLLSALRGQNLPVQFLPQINVFDGQGGPLLANRVYVRNGPLIVPPNRTLTIQPGAIIKLGVSFPFSSARSLVVDGTLIADGATFTSIHDDSVGGDTNGNGASTSPTPGDWDGIEFCATSSGSSRDLTAGGMRRVAHATSAGAMRAWMAWNAPAGSPEALPARASVRNSGSGSSSRIP